MRAISDSGFDNTFEGSNAPMLRDALQRIRSQILLLNGLWGLHAVTSLNNRTISSSARFKSASISSNGRGGV